MGYYESGRTGIRTGKGITTLVNPDSTPPWALALHDGWKFFEHTATAFGLITDISDGWEEVMTNPDVSKRPANNAPGRAALTAVANRSTTRYIDRGWLQSGKVIVDPSRPPEADLAYFTFENLMIALRAERLVLELPFARP
jgi:hypothetical protein